MAYPPLVVTDWKDSNAISSSELSRPEEKLKHLDGFQYVHFTGKPHRSIQVEIVNSQGELFVVQRSQENDARWEIPGGHVDWITDANRAETYEEAALRELEEELKLRLMFGTKEDAVATLKDFLFEAAKFINQVPGSHVNNNEWVTAFRLDWQECWPDLCEHLRGSCGIAAEANGTTAEWKSLDAMVAMVKDNPMNINSALRLLLQRRGVLVPVLLTEYFEKFDKYKAKICPANGGSDDK